jgi:xanthine dehydrogenase accessory factor
MVKLTRMAELESEEVPFALVIVVKAQGSVPRHEGSKMLIFSDGSSEGTIGGGEMERLVIEEGQASLRDGRARYLHYNFSDPDRGDPGVCGGEIDVYVEPVQPSHTLLVFGMGHVGQAVAHLGSWLGFRVIAADDRAEFAIPSTAPTAERVLHCELADLIKEVEINTQTYVVLATRGVPVDVEGLPFLLEKEAGYIGVIGSKRRWETSVKELKEKGVSEELIAKVNSPIGLEIEAESPEEIALSIMAEIVMIYRGGSGESMSHSPKPSREKSGG